MAERHAKINVTAEWTPDERRALACVIEAEVAALEILKTELRKTTVFWEAPCFKEIQAKTSALLDLVRHVERSSAAFLEVNRGQFKNYLQDSLLGKLLNTFAGKKVMILHTGNSCQNLDGVCKTIHRTAETTNHFDIELENEHRLGFIPQVIGPDSVDGELLAFCGGRRGIKLS